MTNALPKLVKNATAAELKHALQSHLEQTETHVERATLLEETLDEEKEADSKLSDIAETSDEKSFQLSALSFQLTKAES